MRAIVVSLGWANGLLAVVLTTASALHIDSFVRVAQVDPVAATAMVLCLPVTLGWLVGGAALAWAALRRRLGAGIVLMAHTMVNALYVLAIVLQPDLTLSRGARVTGVLVGVAALTAAYIVGVESWRRLSRKGAPPPHPTRTPPPPRGPELPTDGPTGLDRGG